MTNTVQKQSAKKFAQYWMFNRPGSEKSGCQQYWNMLLGEVLGLSDLTSGIRYEVPVQLKSATKFLDAWIPSTRVLIEQKSRGVKLDAPQPGHDNMTPFEQAKFYDDHRPFDEKARWIVTCNFDEVWIYADKPLADIYGEDMYFYLEVLKAHEANDAAVLDAYGFSPDATECEIVSRLFDMYEKLTATK